MHAKLAVADHSVLFVTSANLTQSGVGRTSRRACLSGVAQPRPAPPNMSMPCEQAVT